MTLDDFTNDVKINKNKLADESEIQASLFWGYSQQLSKLKGERDTEKYNLELLEAQKDKFYRSQFNEQGTKVTEKIIESTIVSDTDIQEQNRKLLAVQAKVYEWEVAVESMRQRKDGIGNLVSLYTFNYYSENNTDKQRSKLNQ